jgi:hypothetical protein
MALRVAPAVGERPTDEALRALGDHDAETAAVLGEELDTILGGVRGSPWEDVAWCASRLTPSGYPVELGFPGAGGEMRAVAEVAGPEIGPHQRAARALELAGPTGGTAAIERVLRAQEDASLRYGAWVGVRAAPGRPASRKLYLEAPPGSVDVPAATRLRMVGVDGVSGTVERYVMVPRMTRRTLAELLAPVGLDDRAPSLAAIAETCLSPSAGPALSGGPAGFSLAGPGRSGAVAALHLPAWRLGRSDADVRARLLAVAHRHGWDLGAYAAASAPLAGRRHGPPRAHGVVAWVVAPGHPVLVHIGLTPPSAVHQPNRPHGGMS